MASLINTLSVSDIKQCSKEELHTAFLNLNTDKQDIRKLPSNIRKIIIWITEYSKNNDIDLINEENPREKILSQLMESENLAELWIWNLVNDILTKDSTSNESELNYYKKLAYCDKETWLANKAKFLDDISSVEWDKTILLLKIDWFSELNNIYHNSWWDVILKEISNKLKGTYWAKGYEVYRVSWVTFWLLKKWKENNNFNIDNFSINDKELWNVDIEIRTWIASGKNVTFENASIALSNTNKTWEVKEYNQELEDELHSKWLDYLEWKNKVREAIKEWRIVPFFQWIRDNVRWEINKFESLVRLKEWEKVFTPWFFLDKIKWTGLMKDLTRAMVSETIKAMQWNSYSLSINLTEHDINDAQIYDLIKNELKKYGIDSSRLIVEILEETSWTNEKFIKSIERLKKFGIKIAIDDFWTGFSGFWRVYDVKPDFFKIDWSLIKWITEDSSKLEMVRWIISFAHNMWAKVIAEFVETEEIQELLIEMGVDYSQWYLFSKPTEELEI